MPFIYSPQYFAKIGQHVFPVVKYHRVYEKLVGDAGLAKSDFIIPKMATREQLGLVHTEEYLDDLTHCRLTERTRYSELPITEEIIALFVIACGGTIVAVSAAVKNGWAVHLCGGFHHAFADKAEGFCYINDLAVAAKFLQQQNLADRIAIIDCDLHQGNGTAAIFQDDESVFTFSIHQLDLYPIKQTSDLDIHLPIHVADEEYMNHLKFAIPKILNEFQPDFILYQAGADPYIDDQLGSLSLSIRGLFERDEYIFSQCKSAGVPVATTFGGGYACNTDDTVQIHTNTCLAAKEILGLC